MSRQLRLPRRRPFSALAEAYPTRFSTTDGVRLKAVPSGEPGFSVRCDADRVTITHGTTSDLMRALGLWLACPWADGTGGAAMDFRGLMIDCSRNAVLRPESLERILLRLALLGYNAVCLYTEDTYQVKGHPAMGYQRGGYSASELRALDKHAAGLGIEMFPCIQTLAHLEQILKHPRYRGLRDDEHILNLKLPESYRFIEEMIESAAAPYASRRIHVGLDESWGLSRGNAFRPHTPIDPRKDYLDHVRRVARMCRDRKLEPMMWGDIIIGMHGQEAFGPDQARAMPRDVRMVFWNYSHFDGDFYARTIERYRAMGFEPIAAPGLWNWGRLWPSQDAATGTAALFLRTAAAAGVREALLTMWGDDGNEAPFAANWPALAQFANLCWDPDTARGEQFSQVRGVCGTAPEAYVLPGRLDLFPGRERKSIRSFSNLSKAVLWDDPILGTFATHLAGTGLGAHYAGLADEIAAAARGAAPEDRALFAYAAALARSLALKADLNSRARAAYQTRDDRALAVVAADAKRLAGLVERLMTAHSAVWLAESRPFGLEVLQDRYGGQMVRLREMARRIDALRKGEIQAIEEWDERTQKVWDDPATVRVGWAQVSTMCYLRSS